MPRRLCEELHLIEQPSLYYDVDNDVQKSDGKNDQSSSRLMCLEVFGLVLLSFGSKLITYTVEVLENAFSCDENRLAEEKACSILKLDSSIVEILLSPNDQFIAVRTKQNILIYEAAALLHKVSKKFCVL